MFSYPCPLCPQLLLRGAGEVGRLAYEAGVLLSQAPSPDHPPSWELVFEMLGVTVATVKRRVYGLVARWAQIQRDDAEAKKPEHLRTVRNPHA